MATPDSVQPDQITIEVHRTDVDELRVMLREQIAGDEEQLRWVRDHPGEPKRAADHHLCTRRLKRRVDLCWDIAQSVGGVY